MKILLIGSGGREHAFSWKMSQSPLVQKIYGLPGNAGMAFNDKVELVPGKVTDIDFIVKTAKDLAIDLVVVGPEQPLSLGLVDALEKEGVVTFGPTKEAAQLESSKVYSKRFMNEYGIPTAKASEYHSYKEAMASLDSWDLEKGIAIKADELAAGKGVVVTCDREEAEKVLFDFMENPECSVKTKSILIEEKLTGKEVSAFAICDGEDYISVGYACDYKRVGDGDIGPNTGGMGGYSPKNWPSEECKKQVDEKVFEVVLRGMKERGAPFKGILFAGLFVEGDTPKIIEFNVRFGDPETQILMPLIEGDLVPTFLAAAKGEIKKLGTEKITMKKETAVHVVMASEGYPSTDGTPMTLGEKISYTKGLIPGEGTAPDNQENFLFLAGVKTNEEGDLINSGGRVLGLTALGEELDIARNLAYKNLKDISFKGAHWRKDIGR